MHFQYNHLNLLQDTIIKRYAIIKDNSLCSYEAIVTILSSGLNDISLYPSILPINLFMNKDVNKIYLHFTMLKGIFNHLFLIATDELDKVWRLYLRNIYITFIYDVIKKLKINY